MPSSERSFDVCSPVRRLQMGIDEANEYLNRWEKTRADSALDSAISAMRAACDTAERVLNDV